MGIFVIRKCMYGLKEAGILAFKCLVKKVALSSYHIFNYTPIMWTHDNRNSMFELAVDDVGIKYSSIDVMQHLIYLLRND